MKRIIHRVKWREVPGLPHYRISNEGMIVSSACILEQRIGEGGYSYVQMFRQGGQLLGLRNVHDLVWKAFGGVKNNYGLHIHHKDGNKQNNHIDNLELLSAKDHKQFHQKLKKSA